MLENVRETSGAKSMKQLTDFITSHANCREMLIATIFALNKAKIPYALIGSLARMCYLPDVKPTKDADFLLLADKRPALLNLLPQIPHDSCTTPHHSMLTLQWSACEVSMEFLFATPGFDPESACVRDTVQMQFLGKTIRLAKPEYLVWMLVHSPHERHKVAVRQLLSSGCVNKGKLANMMYAAGEYDAMRMLSGIVLNPPYA